MKSHIVLFLAQFFPFILAAQTVAYYHFDGTNGAAAATILDSGPSGFDGSVVGTANYSAGVINAGLDLSGDFNYVTIPQSTDMVLSNSWTVEMFFRANVPYSAYGSDPSALINKLNTPDPGNFLDSFSLQLSAGGTIYAQIGFGNLDGREFDTGSQGDFADGQWHHVALVYQMNGGATNTASMYVDYALLASVSGAYPALGWASYPINIGAGNYPDNEDTSPFRRNFDGQIDEVRISDAALTPAQFVQLPAGQFAPLSIQGVDGGVLLSWGSVTNKTYQLQTRTDLMTGSWANLGQSSIGTGNTLSLQDPFVAGRSQSFYRLSVSP